MKETRNYVPTVTINGEEWVGEPMDCATAYTEAVRMKTERHAEKAGVKVFHQNHLFIKSWKDGIHYYRKGAYLYTLSV